LRFLAYLWASPATALGLLCLPLAWASGGHAALVDGAAYDRKEVAVFERRDDERGAVALRFLLGDRIRPGGRDDHRQVRLILLIADGELETVVLVETELGDQEIGHHRLEEVPGAGERRLCLHQESLFGEERLRVTKQSRIGLDEDDQS